MNKHAKADLPVNIEKELYEMTEQFIKDMPQESAMQMGLFYLFSLVLLVVFIYAFIYGYSLWHSKLGNIGISALLATATYAIVTTILTSIRLLQGDLRRRKMIQKLGQEQAERLARIEQLERDNKNLIIDEEKHDGHS